MSSEDSSILCSWIHVDLHYSSSWSTGPAAAIDKLCTLFFIKILRRGVGNPTTQASTFETTLSTLTFSARDVNSSNRYNTPLAWNCRSQLLRCRGERLLNIRVNRDGRKENRRRRQEWWSTCAVSRSFWGSKTHNSTRGGRPFLIPKGGSLCRAELYRSRESVMFCPSKNGALEVVTWRRYYYRDIGHKRGWAWYFWGDFTPPDNLYQQLVTDS